jgi:hypothetical protein
VVIDNDTTVKGTAEIITRRPRSSEGSCKTIHGSMNHRKSPSQNKDYGSNLLQYRKRQTKTNLRLSETKCIHPMSTLQNGAILALREIIEKNDYFT